MQVTKLIAEVRKPLGQYVGDFPLASEQDNAKILSRRDTEFLELVDDPSARPHTGLCLRIASQREIIKEVMKIH